MEIGMHDSFREFSAEAGHYSWWDYRGGSFQRDRGLRIDYVWLSTSAHAKVQAAYIDRMPRSWDKPSDHTPVVADLAWPP
jgi:exodeoxyribonuclease III